VDELLTEGESKVFEQAELEYQKVKNKRKTAERDYDMRERAKKRAKTLAELIYLVLIKITQKR